MSKAALVRALLDSCVILRQLMYISFTMLAVLNVITGRDGE